MAKALYSPFSGYILYDAVYSGTVPSPSYSLAQFNYFRPDWNILWGATSATVTATLAGGARKADLFALPKSNIDAGSLRLTLTNGAGLNITVQVPAVPTGPYGRLMLTTVCDLRPLASAATRTSNVWNVVVTSNSVNVKMGSAIWLGTAVDFTHNFRPRAVQSAKYSNGTEQNFFGVVNRVRSRTRERAFTFDVPTRDPQRDSIFEWADSGEGSGLPSVFVPDPAVNDALVGSWPDAFANSWVLVNYSPIDGVVFSEWSKGVPFL